MKKLNVTINNQTISAEEGKTLLEVIQEQNLDYIPTLCHDKRLNPYGSCFLCVVEVQGLNRLVPSCATPVAEGMVVNTNNERIKSSRKTALEFLLSNHYADCIGPCTNNCPARVDAQSYIALISMGKGDEALKLIKENNPLPLSIGRVCVRDCETTCRRDYVDDAVAINALKRHVADSDLKNMWVPEIKEKKNKKVAIVGGGPSGLTCAYYLTLEGYSPTIFEKLPKLGGMLRYGIPSYRLPREILDNEIKWITDLGVEVITNVEMGKDFTLSSLKEQGFESVFLGVGAHKASRMGLHGESEISGVLGGIDFLRVHTLNGEQKVSGHVVIVGGGNTAIDAARTSLRSGASKVSIVYRRSISEMPAHHEEIEAAQAEGIDIRILTHPVDIHSEKGKLKGIRCIKMKLEEQPGKRPRPVPVEGSEFDMDCDILISAIGQQVDDSFLTKDPDCKLDERWGTLMVKNENLETTVKGVFAGGDAVTGPLSAISSIAQGKKAAIAIDKYLRGDNTPERKKFLSFKHNLATLGEFDFKGYSMIARNKMAELSLEERQTTFKEVELGLSCSQVEDETARCIECGCSEYYDCELRKYADDYEIDINNIKGEVRKYEVDKRHPFITIDSNKCINCGRCVRTCSEILKVSALGFVYRGFKTIVKPAMEKALSDTNCISCGNCVDTCPTGALMEKFPFKVLGTLKKDNYETICNFCSIGCKINVKVLKNDIYFVSNSTDSIRDSHNKGYLCPKGRFGHRYLNNLERSNSIIVKNGNQITDYDQTAELIANRINQIIEKYGNDSVAVFGSPKLSNEEMYLLQKLARAGFKTNNIASLTNIFNGGTNVSLDKIFGFTGSTTSKEELINADVIIAVNSDLSEDNLIIELKIKEAQKNGAKLVLINSSEIKLEKFADLWLDNRKGTNTLIINALISSVLNSDDSKNYMSNDIENLDDLKKSVNKYNIDEVSELSGVDKSKIINLINMISDPEKNVIFIYNGDSSLEKSKYDLEAVANFLVLTGRVNKESNGLLLLKNYVNSAAINNMGLSPEYLPGFVKSDETKEKETIESKWGVNLSSFKPEIDIKERLLQQKIKAVLIIGENPLQNSSLRKYFEGVEFMVVSDLSMTETAMEADVFIPMRSLFEKSGSFITFDNRLQNVEPFIVNDISQTWEVLAKIGHHFGNGFDYNSDSEIFNEICSVNRTFINAELDNYIPINDAAFVFENGMRSYIVDETDLSQTKQDNLVILNCEKFYNESIKIN